MVIAIGPISQPTPAATTTIEKLLEITIAAWYYTGMAIGNISQPTPKYITSSTTSIATGTSATVTAATAATDITTVHCNRSSISVRRCWNKHGQGGLPWQMPFGKQECDCEANSPTSVNTWYMPSPCPAHKMNGHFKKLNIIPTKIHTVLQSSGNSSGTMYTVLHTSWWIAVIACKLKQSTRGATTLLQAFMFTIVKWGMCLAKL